MIAQPLAADEFPDGDDRVEALWVDGLLRSLGDSPTARSARVETFLDRLNQETPAVPNREAIHRRLVRRSWAVAAVAASLLLGAFLMERFAGSAQASVESLVRLAKQTLQTPVDRCYLVQFEPQPGEESALRHGEVRLWTRGDRFWFTTVGARHIAGGREANGSIWVARNPQVGIRYEADEADIPAELSLSISVYSMQLDALLDDVLRDFDLHGDEPRTTGETRMQTIRAELKPGHEHPSVKSAVLEIDTRTHAVQRLTLWRRQSIVTYTLAETGRQDDAQYTLEGHLQPDARVFTRSLNPELRRQKYRGD
jgi:hypothetical protein